MEHQIKLGIYEHYKGNQYRVLGVAKHSETLEEVVVYEVLSNQLTGHQSLNQQIHVLGEIWTRGLDGDLLWVRPKNMFLEEVLVDGKMMPRFRYLGVNG